MWEWFLYDHDSWCLYVSKSNFCQSELWQVEQKGNLLVYLKFLPLKFLIACFYRTFSRPWCLLNKSVPMNLENHSVTTLFEVSLFRFILFLHLSIYVITMNIQWSKLPPYTLSSLWNLHFLSVFYFWKVKKETYLFLNTSTKFFYGRRWSWHFQ